MKPTQEQVIAWAREVELFATTSILMKFATLAYEAGRKDENEACADLCDYIWMHSPVECEGADECADAIRARREQ
jgi:hypothetical protein